MNCHLLVPDLFHAAGARAELYGGLRLPALETLLARGNLNLQAGASLESWLARTFRIAASPDLPLGALSLQGHGVDPGGACWLHADPVHLRIHRDQLLLTDTGHPALTAGEARELTGALSTHFAGEGLEFISPVPQHWYARTREEPRIRTTPTAEAIGRRIEPLLPQGDDGARWRRIINEAQMLLHGHPCNEAREARGDLPVNSVWLWGAGRAPRIQRDASYGALWSSHPLVNGIATNAGLPLRPLPQSGAQILEQMGSDPNSSNSSQLLVVDALRASLGGGVDAWRTALADMDARWFTPLLAGLNRGALSSLTLHALGSDRSCTVTASRFDSLKFWRRKRALGHYAKT